MGKERVIIGIDPAVSKPVGYGVISGGKLYKSGHFETMTQALRILALADMVYIEDQFLKNNPNTLKKLSHSTGKIMGLCEVLSVPYELVSPSTWQNRVNLPGKRPAELSDYRWKKEKAERMVLTAKDITGHEAKNDDEAAGILIAYSMGVLESGKSD